MPANLSSTSKIIDTILVLDFGSQYTQLIARRVRDSNVYSEILPWDIDEKKILDLNPKGVVLSGGPNSVTDSYTPRVPQCIFELNVPILGICYGMQTLAEQMGGQVVSVDKKEFGHTNLEVENKSVLFKDINKKINVWMSHGDQVQDLPDEFELIASTQTAPIAAMQHKSLPIYAIQFHPEVTHTQDGHLLLNNFLFEVCHAHTDWKMNDLISSRIEEIKDQVQDNKVLLGLSGGVDSSVAAAILNKSIGKNLYCVFVNNGLLRKNEFNDVLNQYKKMDLNVIGVDYSEDFYKNLKGIIDPEIKRKIIGRVFIESFEKESKKIKNVKWLAQGTIYPDVIESISATGGPSSTIKSHHNVGGLPEKMKLKVIEPLKLLFKDEVRKVGGFLGIDKSILGRHPFPGPGLGIRILDEINLENINILQEVDDIFISGLKEEGLYDKIWQAGAILLPVKSVGVMGDERTYEKCVALRAVESTDGMTADWVNLPYNFLQDISNKIINRVKGVNRVVYDISSKPPATIEWE